MTHKIEPMRQGRRATCKVCGNSIVWYRKGNRVAGKGWRHMSYQQTPGYLNLINPNGSF